MMRRILPQCVFRLSVPGSGRLGSTAMSEWYYSKDGTQLGPVSEMELKNLLSTGALDARTALVWKSGMTDWIPAAQVPEFANPFAASDPYAAPVSGFVAADGAIPLPEIAPGSESIDPMACFKRGFDLAVRHIGTVLIMVLVYMAVSVVLHIGLSAMDKALGWGGPPEVVELGDGTEFSFGGTASPANSIISNLVSIFLALGLTRFTLSIVSGRNASAAQLFGEGRLFIRGLFASILFGIMIAVGFLLLIAPGIYLIARYGFYMHAIVDRNCGIIQSFETSSRLTTNNRGNMVLVMLLSIAAVVIGCLAFCIGIFFAYPVVCLAWTVAYRWLQYGHRAAMDHPGTTTPMLTPTHA